jgi:hypothetical protein
MPRMSRSVLVGTLLVASLLANVLLGAKLAVRDEKAPLVDARLIGSWLSKAPNGYRVIFLSSGEVVVAKYGTPYGGAGKWAAERGELSVRWSIDEDDETLRDERCRYSISADGSLLELSRGVFSVAEFKTLSRAAGKP